MFRIPVIALALVLSAPALWSAFVEGSASVQSVLVRFLIAVPLSALMVAAFTSMTSSYERQTQRARHRAERVKSEQ
jgi:hypothetical protein